MIGKLVDHINSLLDGIVDKTYGIAITIEEEKGSFPAFYENGELFYVTDFDNFYNGLSYLRMNGKTKHSYPIDKLKSRDEQIQLNIPLRLVLFVKKKNLNIDDAYSSDRIAYNVISLISSKNPELRRLIKAKSAKILTTEHDSDSESVLKAEYKGEAKSIDPKYAYLSIDFDIEILIDKTCMNECCL